jgi:hypothetical protein
MPLARSAVFLLLAAAFPLSFAQASAALLLLLLLLQRQSTRRLTFTAAAVCVRVLFLLQQVPLPHHLPNRKRPTICLSVTRSPHSVVVTTLGGTISAALCTGHRPSSLAVHPLTGDLYVASAGASTPNFATEKSH